MKIIAITPDRKRDYTTEQTLEGLKELGCEILATDIGNGIENSFTDEQLLSRNDIDGVVAFFGKVRDNRPPRHYLAKILKDKFPLIYVDGSEWTCTGYPQKDQMKDSLSDAKKRRGEPWLHGEMLSIAKHYFKRECYPEDLKNNVIPHPFCLTKRHLMHSPNKDIDLMCVFGQTSTGMRQRVMDLCQSLKQQTNFKIVVESNLNSEQYREVVGRSRIIIDAWGGGDTCDRFYEAVGAGACCLYQKYNVVVQNPFEDMYSAVEYWDEKSFVDRVKLLLNSSDLCLRIGERGKQHALSYHTSQVRARKILQLLSR